MDDLNKLSIKEFENLKDNLVIESQPKEKTYEPNKKFPIKKVLIAKFCREQWLFSQLYGKGSKNVSFNTLFTQVVIKNDADVTKKLINGPYETRMPISLNRKDKYKFVVKVLLDNSFTVQSGKVLYQAGFSYMMLRKKKRVWRSTRWLVLKTFRDVVIVWLIKYGFKKYTYDMLKEEI